MTVNINYGGENNGPASSEIKSLCRLAWPDVAVALMLTGWLHLSLEIFYNFTATFLSLQNILLKISYI